MAECLMGLEIQYVSHFSFFKSLYVESTVVNRALGIAAPPSDRDVRGILQKIISVVDREGGGGY